LSNGATSATAKMTFCRKLSEGQKSKVTVKVIISDVAILSVVLLLLSRRSCIIFLCCFIVALYRLWGIESAIVGN